MKLVIQIPCFNEEEALPVTLSDLPEHIAGIDSIEIVVVDDGSSDQTILVAQEWGVRHIVRHPANQGLAAAFQSGVNYALKLGADIIVNTDADNQYPGSAIPELVRPILLGKAEIVVADRQVHLIEHFSLTKRWLQRIGSAVVRAISGTSLPDAPSGFRAYSREAALRLTVLTKYTYTLETIVQAGKKKLVVGHVPVVTNPKLRESRLMRNMWDYVWRSAVTLLRLFALYEPARTFAFMAAPLILVGVGLWGRYLWLVLTANESLAGRYVQSVIVGSALLIIGFVVGLFGILAELVATNRRLQEETLYYMKRMALDPGPSKLTEAELPPVQR